MRSDVAKALSKAIEPFVRKLAAELAAVLTEHVEQRLEAARTTALEKLQAELATPDQETDDDEEAQEAAEAKATEERPRGARDGVDGGTREPSRRAARPRREGARPDDAAGGPRCSKCQEPGHSSRSCGRAPKGRSRQAAATEPAPAPLAAAPPPSAKSDRFARIEAAAAARRAGADE